MTDTKISRERPSQLAMEIAVHMEAHAALSTTTEAKAREIDALLAKERLTIRHQEPVEPAGSIYGDYTPITINAPVNEPIVTEPLLHGVCDSLRAAIFEYEDRGLYPGARKVMQAQLDVLTASLQKQESGE